jgi:hypothetical protein
MTPLALLLCAQAAAQTFVAPPTPRRVEVRFPTLEVFVLRTPELGASDPLPLTPGERVLAEGLFGKSLDYDAIRVVTVRFKISVAMVAGTYVRMPRSEYTTRWLVHELVHVWQYQTAGAAYVSQALCEHVSGKPYAYTLVPGKPLGDYGIEQQAEIIEDWFADPAKRKDPRYQALAEQLKQRLPRYRTNVAGTEEASRMPLDPRVPPSHVLPVLPRSGELPAIMPQLELRF